MKFKSFTPFLEILFLFPGISLQARNLKLNSVCQTENGKLVKLLTDVKKKKYYAYKLKSSVDNLVFVTGTKPDKVGKSSIWEPLNARSGLFTRKGNDLYVTPLMSVYKQLSKKYLRYKK